jgi:uncharacterized protein YbjT (DUF2867 family)
LADLDVVTGAFSYTGRAIAERLLEAGRRVRTLSRRAEPEDPLAQYVEVAPLQFADESALAESLRGARRLYVTYWIRFQRGPETFERAVENTRALFRAALAAGVERVVHVSVTNPDEASPLPYFRGKARLERDLAATGLSFAIVRPTLVFGAHDLLVNNMAWIVRRSPLFPIAGDGRYRVQPVSVEDVAEICVTAAERGEDVTLDAAGPETFEYVELVRAIAGAVGSRARIVHVSSRLALALAGTLGRLRRDVVLTAEELAGLMDSLLVSAAPPLGRASFREWLAAAGPALGRSYVSELDRNFRPYAPL